MFEVEYQSGTAGSRRMELMPIKSNTIALTLDTDIDFTFSSRFAQLFVAYYLMRNVTIISLIMKQCTVALNYGFV